MARDIQPHGDSIDIYLSAPSEYERYHIVGLTGSMYVTDRRNLGDSFKYHFSIYTDRYYVYTGNTYLGTKPTSLNTRLFNSCKICNSLFIFIISFLSLQYCFLVAKFLIFDFPNK